MTRLWSISPQSLVRILRMILQNMELCIFYLISCGNSRTMMYGLHHPSTSALIAASGRSPVAVMWTSVHVLCRLSFRRWHVKTIQHTHKDPPLLQKNYGCRFSRTLLSMALRSKLNNLLVYVSLLTFETFAGSHVLFFSIRTTGWKHS